VTREVLRRAVTTGPLQSCGYGLGWGEPKIDDMQGWKLREDGILVRRKPTADTKIKNRGDFGRDTEAEDGDDCASPGSAYLDYRTTHVLGQCRTYMVLYRRLEYGRWAGNYPGRGEQDHIHAISSMKVTPVPVLDVEEILSIQYIDDLQSSDAFDLDVDIGG
jgi:hypothetical protein